MKKPFVPNMLPLSLSSDEIISLYKIALEARVKIQEFNTLLERSVISESIMMYFSMHESIESTKIEGTQATFNDVLESELSGEKSNDVQEVLNYLTALNYGSKRLDTMPISTRLFHELHSIILNNSRGQNRSPGEFRRLQNFIGPTNDIKDASYIPPEPQLINAYISNLENYINDDTLDHLDYLIKAGIIHAQFETIHPYLDGNGRLGRILIILYLLEKKVIQKPSFFLSEELEKNKYKYYGLLNNLRKSSPDWYRWLEFFLKSSINQANKYVKKLKLIELKYQEIIDVSNKNNVRIDIVSFIFQKPYFMISDVQSFLNISYNTAQNHINKLVEVGVLFHDGKRRNRSYRFYDVLDILNS